MSRCHKQHKSHSSIERSLYILTKNVDDTRFYMTYCTYTYKYKTTQNRYEASMFSLDDAVALKSRLNSDWKIQPYSCFI
jgi:hypothetical protein